MLGLEGYESWPAILLTGNQYVNRTFPQLLFVAHVYYVFEIPSK